jgi:hypothetical protein
MSKMRRIKILACTAAPLALLAAGSAGAGAVSNLYHGGAYGLPWSAGKGAVQAKYPGGKWDTDENGFDRYCASSRQTLLKLPPPHQSRELCFVIGRDGTMVSATAVMDASLPSLLAIVNRCRTTFGDYDAMVRDQQAIQSKYNGMLWTRDAPYVVRVLSENDPNGRPVTVTYTVADEASLYTNGAAKVANVFDRK